MALLKVTLFVEGAQVSHTRAILTGSSHGGDDPLAFTISDEIENLSVGEARSLVGCLEALLVRLPPFSLEGKDAQADSRISREIRRAFETLLRKGDPR